MPFYRFSLSSTLFTFVYLFFTSVALSHPVVKVSGSATSQELKELAELYLEHLDVREKIHLTVSLSQSMPATLSGITISLPVQNPDIDHMFMVLIDAKLDKATTMRVLAHEMIHVKQYAKKELVVDENKVVWQGNKYRYHRHFNLYTPWEQEAHYADRLLVRSVQNKQKKSKVPSLEETAEAGLDVSLSSNEENLEVESNAVLQPENSHE